MARSVFPANPIQTSTSPSGEEKAKATAPRRAPIIKGGAASDRYIKAAAQGGADRTYQEVSVDQIKDSAIRDRIDVREDLESLIESIRDKGQQIPIMVRVVQADKPYEVVVGRRRLAAIRELGLPTIKAFVSRMDDREALIIQGIENNERLETSFIERARAAAQAIDAGYDLSDVCEFLSVSKPLVSMMVNIYRDIGEEVVTAIGPARGIGRRKWETLAQQIKQHGLSPADVVAMVNKDLGSVERFEALLDDIRSGARTPKSRRKAHEQSTRQVFLGGALSTVRKPRQLVVKTNSELPEEILDRIHASIEEIVENWKEEESSRIQVSDIKQ